MVGEDEHWVFLKRLLLSKENDNDDTDDTAEDDEDDEDDDDHLRYLTQQKYGTKQRRF